MIKTFADAETEAIWDGDESKRARRRLPSELWKVAQDKLDMLNAAETLEDLRWPPGNRPERLRGDRRGQWSIRINSRYRICFQFDAGDVFGVEIVDYHRG